MLLKRIGDITDASSRDLDVYKHTRKADETPALTDRDIPVDALWHNPRTWFLPPRHRRIHPRHLYSSENIFYSFKDLDILQTQKNCLPNLFRAAYRKAWLCTSPSHDLTLATRHHKSLAHSCVTRLTYFLEIVYKLESPPQILLLWSTFKQFTGDGASLHMF
jgi:hypothetical protein